MIPRSTTWVRLATVAPLVISGWGCAGNIDGGPGDAGPRFDLGVDAGSSADLGTVDGGAPNLVVVPASLTSLSVTSACTALATEERALAVDTEGHLWLARPDADGVVLRILDAFGEDPEQSFTTRFQRIDALTAHSATTASVIADGSAWFFEEGSRFGIQTPFAVGADASACGNLRNQAFVASAGELHQRVSDGWLRWEGLEPALSDRFRVLPRDGACQGGSDAVWLLRGEPSSILEVWTLGPAEITRSVALEGATHAVPRAEEILLLVNRELRRSGNPSLRHRFEAGGVSAVAAGGRYAWLMVGPQLVRFDGERFEAVDVDLGGAPDALHAFAAGGLWTVAEREVCAHLPPGTLRIRGVEPGAHGVDPVLRWRAQPREPEAEVTARLGGVELPAVAVEDDVFVFEAALELGWSQIVLTVSPPGSTRSLAFKRDPTVSRSWDTDIRPIFDNHCALAGCHVAGNSSGAPELASHRDWVLRATAIERRVLDQQDMPPSASRGPGWGMETRRVIEEWLAGGLKP